MTTASNNKHKYRLLPFNFRNLGSHYIIVSETGRFHKILREDIIRLIRREISPSEDIFLDLKAKDILCLEYSQEIVDVWAAKYRTKKKHIFDKPSLHMIVATHRCNQKCKYCHASASSEGKDISIETIKKCVDFILRESSTYIKIEFQGGEPTLNFKIVKACVEEFKDRALSNNKIVEFVLCTNLYDINNSIKQYCCDNNIQISTSLDGPDILHDSCRLSADGKPTHHKVIENINDLKSNYKIYPSALLTVTNKNVDKLFDVINHYKATGFSSIFIRSLNPFGRAGGGSEDLAYPYDYFIKKYIDALEYIIEINKNGHFFVEEYASILLTKILTPLNSGYVDLLSPTGAGISCLIYEINGDIFVSDEARMRERVTHDKRYKVGNVIKNSYNECIESAIMKKIVESSVIESIPGCAWCAYAPYCGHDPIRNYQLFNDEVGFRPNDPMCKLNTTTFDYLFSKIFSDNDSLRIFWSWVKRNESEIKQ